MLLVVLLITALPTEKEGAIYEDTLRLHILANSDSDRDQALKLEIRDKILEKYAGELSSEISKNDAVSKIESLRDEIKRDVDAWVISAGEDYTSRVDIGTEWYETREYESFTLPKGYYTSVRVCLGEAEGQNWWCVMYPPLCLDIATGSPRDDAISSYTEEEAVLIDGKGYAIKFKLLEVVSELFKR